MDICINRNFINKTSVFCYWGKGSAVQKVGSLFSGGLDSVPALTWLAFTFETPGLGLQSTVLTPGPPDTKVMAICKCRHNSYTHKMKNTCFQKYNNYSTLY